MDVEKEVRRHPGEVPLRRRGDGILHGPRRGRVEAQQLALEPGRPCAGNEPIRPIEGKPRREAHARARTAVLASERREQNHGSLEEVGMVALVRPPRRVDQRPPGFGQQLREPFLRPRSHAGHLRHVLGRVRFEASAQTFHHRAHLHATTRRVYRIAPAERWSSVAEVERIEEAAARSGRLADRTRLQVEDIEDVVTPTLLEIRLPKKPARILAYEKW